MTEAICVIPACGRRARTLNRTLCTTHYNRTKTGQSMDDPVRPYKREHLPCVVDGCPNLDVASHGHCTTHILRLRRHGSTDARPQHETDHPRWSGDNASYSAVHQRVRKAKGPASDHRCVDCGGRAEHWSYTQDDPNEMQSTFGAYSTDAARYVPRCVRCHKRFDLAQKDAS